MGVMVIKTPIFARMCYTVSFCREGLASYNIIIHYVYTLFSFSKVYIENDFIQMYVALRLTNCLLEYIYTIDWLNCMLRVILFC